MLLRGKVKKGLGNAYIWVKKIEALFQEKEGIKLFSGTLNIELEEEFNLTDYWTINPWEYGGTQNVFVKECSLYGNKCYILRPEQTAHGSNIIEIVSYINLRKKYNLKDDDEVEIIL